MIEYYFGERKCKLDWNIFLHLTINNEKRYKSDFKDFSLLYEFIDKNKKSISNILLDGYEYFLEKGVLHNLYGPAYIRYNNDNDDKYGKKGFFQPEVSYFFYIDGKLVYDNLNIDRGCKNVDKFNNSEIFHLKILTKELIDSTTGKYKRRIEGIDYIKTYINLEDRIKKDIRKKKLIKLKEY